MDPVPPDTLSRHRVPRHRLALHAHHRLGEVGILGEDDRVELREGQLVATSDIAVAVRPSRGYPAPHPAPDVAVHRSPVRDRYGSTGRLASSSALHLQAARAISIPAAAPFSETFVVVP